MASTDSNIRITADVAGAVARLTDVLHARQAHPDYEYSVTFPHCAEAHTSREGWERNPQADQTPHAIHPAMLGWRRLRAEDVDPATRDPYAYPDGYDAVTDAHGNAAGPIAVSTSVDGMSPAEWSEPETWEVVWSGRRTGGWFSRTFTDKGEAEQYADELLTANLARKATVQRSA